MKHTHPEILHNSDIKQFPKIASTAHSLAASSSKNIRGPLEHPYRSDAYKLRVPSLYRKDPTPFFTFPTVSSSVDLTDNANNSSGINFRRHTHTRAFLVKI